VNTMFCGNWSAFWGHSYYCGGLVGMLFQVAIWVLVVWALVSIIQSLAINQTKISRKRGVK
jgi:hypothetical protein